MERRNWEKLDIETSLLVPDSAELHRHGGAGGHPGL